MNKQKKKWLIAKDLTEYLSFAHLWYLGIIVVIFILMFIFLGRIEAPISDFLSFSHGSSKVYMLIMGIISAYYFIPMYVQMGVTRKQTVIGNAIGAVGGALTLVLLATIISGIQHLIFEGFDLTVANEESLFQIVMNFPEGTESTHFLLGQSFFAGLSRWLITLSSFWLSVLLDYMIGWLIGTGFYHRGVVGGVGTILIGMLLAAISDVFWNDGILPFMPDVTFQGDPFYLWLVAIVATIVLIGVAFWLIRQLTKRMTIKY